MHGSALRCVISDSLSLCNNGKFDPLYKYKTVRDIEKPFGIYHYVGESSCCAKFLQKLAHSFWVGK